MLTSFLVIAAVFVFLDYRLFHSEALRWSPGESRLAGVLAVVSWVAQIAFLVLVVGGVLVGRETLFGLSIFGLLHFTAAGLLIGNLSFAVASHALPDRARTPQQNADWEPSSDAARRGYLVIMVAMWGGIVVGGICIALEVPYAVIVTEYVEIGLFVAYWLVATRRDWRHPA